jgi:hypothetical protein
MVRWLVRIVVGLAVLAAAGYFGARLHDGPLGPIPGGPLRAGELVTEPVADWSFAQDVPEIDLQLASQSQSRTVWVLVHDGQAYVPCSLGFPPGKTWYRYAAQDGRATLRISGRRYPVTLTRVDDESLVRALRAEVERKYTNLPPTDAGVWVFRVSSRPASGEAAPGA